MHVGFGKLKTQRKLTHGSKVRRSSPKLKPCWFMVGVMVSLALLMSCSGSGGGGGGGAEAVAGFEVPDEISVVPPAEDAEGHTTATSNLSLKASLKSLARAAADAGTDYSEAKTSKYVEEHTLEQFEIIEQVLQAINQTHYADAENIDNGPYKSIIAWEDEQNGIDVKQLEPWIVISEYIEEDGQDVLRVRAWIEEQEEDETLLVKAEFKIYESATKNADGSYQDYGVWELNVKFDDDAEDFFAASASVGPDGEAIIKLHESFLEDFGFDEDLELPAVMKAIMYRSDTTGYGKVYHPDWDSLWGPDFDPSDLVELPHMEAIYAYNSSYLAVQNEDDDDPQYKDRSDVVEMTHRYGIYDAETGDDVMKTKSFGFPIKYTLNGLTRHAYYGAWQGRHQIWTHGEGDAIPEGTEVSRQDFGSDEEPETYTVGPTFNGVLVKRTYVDASLNDIKNIPVEIWINQDYSLLYNAGDQKWYHCDNVNWQVNPIECLSTAVDFAAEIGFASLIVEETNNRKHVNINGWDNNLEQNIQFVYALASDGDVPQDGFYEAVEEMGDYGSRMVLKDDPVTPISPGDVPQLWIYIGGSIYVEWDGDGWVEKELENFNENTWTPEFGPNDKAYNLPENQELYINMQGVNYVVRKDADGTTVKMELQTAVNPDNVAEIVPDNTIFSDPWNPDTSSTFELVTDPDDDNYLMLVYLTVSEFDDQNGVSVGDIATNVWGIETTYEGDDEPTAFNWEYSESGGWGSVTYLLNSDESYKLLDDPMRFNSIEAENNAGDTKTLALQFDGWMMGLPQMYDELGKNNWTMTPTIADKIINLPTGTALTESDTGDQYLLKPLDISQFLTLVTDTTGLDLPDISQAEDVDLDSVPDYVEHGMGDMPDVTTIKYSEGILVE